MFRKIALLAGVALLALPLSQAQASVGISLNFGIPLWGGHHHHHYGAPNLQVGVVIPPPGAVAPRPAPLYVPPPPVAYPAPAPVYPYPQPVPGPVYVQPAPAATIAPPYPR